MQWHVNDILFLQVSTCTIITDGAFVYHTDLSLRVCAISSTALNALINKKIHVNDIEFLCKVTNP
jgi:hypothetical protein